MIAISSSRPRPTRTSTSRPRSLKISTARGDRSSAINTFGIAGYPFVRKNRTGEAASGGRSGLAYGAPGPIEPGEQRVQVRGLHGGTGPDPQARRGVAIMADIHRHPLGFEPGGHLLRNLRLGGCWQSLEPR